LPFFKKPSKTLNYNDRVDRFKGKREKVINTKQKEEAED